MNNLHVLTNMLSFTVVWQIPDLSYWYQPNPGLTLDTFLFPVTTLNNFSAQPRPNIQPYSSTRWTGTNTLGEIAPHLSPSYSHPMEVSWPSCNCPDSASIQLNLAGEPIYNRCHTCGRRDSPPIPNSQLRHTSFTVPTPSTSPVLHEPADVTIT